MEAGTREYLTEYFKLRSEEFFRWPAEFPWLCIVAVANYVMLHSMIGKRCAWQ
jgi:hypothetical protein